MIQFRRKRAVSFEALEQLAKSGHLLVLGTYIVLIKENLASFEERKEKEKLHVTHIPCGFILWITCAKAVKIHFPAKGSHERESKPSPIHNRCLVTSSQPPLPRDPSLRP